MVQDGDNPPPFDTLTVKKCELDNLMTSGEMSVQTSLDELKR